MNEKELEKLFAGVDAEPDAGARSRALNAALRVFDEEQAAQKNASASQGFATGDRLTSERPSFGRRIMQYLSSNNPAQRWLYSGMASAAVLVVGVFVALQLPLQKGYQLPPATTPDFRVSEGTVSENPLIDLDESSAGSRPVIMEKPAKADAATIQPPALNDPAYVRARDVASHEAGPALRVETERKSSADMSQTAESAVAAAARAAAAPPQSTVLDARRAGAHAVLGESIASFAGAPPSTLALADGVAMPGYQEVGRDRFDTVETNPVKRTSAEPVSTFSIDVDTASYSFVRRQLNGGVLPQKAAVRLEEMVNYFPYDYPLPTDRSQPFSTNVTVIDSPWKAGNKLVHIGIQGYDMLETQPRSNLVFLLDVSGSMNSPDKLPLVKQSMGLLLSRLQPEDTVSIVVYAGAAGTVLEPTPVRDKQKILSALNRLQAGGSTAGAQGIQLAYQLAESQFIEDGVNRIVLATDGDFNVGIRNSEELKGFVERKRASGVFLSVLGFGQGNYQDSLMQALAQNGNGVAAYIDTLGEAQKVLVDEATSALFPIATDVKIQVEFNPATVSEYRLLGYETRMLAEEDFNNDAVDAGDIGAGHSVTAIYEITPVASDSGVFSPSRYGEAPVSEDKSDEYGYLKLRYKLPGEDVSRLISQPIVAGSESTPDMLREARFATAVAGFAQLLQGGKYLADWGYSDARQLAQVNRGDDPYGYRAEFIQLVRKAEVAGAM
jgi:Ca-activated chloride channel homolog